MVTNTTTRAPAPRIAGAGDVDLVADIVTDAFFPLKVIENLVPDPGRRWEVSRAWYRLLIEDAIGGAGQVVITDDGSAATVWFDRTGKVHDPEDYDKRLAALAGDDLPQFQHLDQLMAASHPTDPHWYLMLAATRPDRQHEGLGGMLLDYTHQRLDADGVPGYLEATGPKNQRLYERKGFEVMTPPTIPVTDGIDLIRMWRPVRNG